MNPTIAPSMTVTQIAALLDEHQEDGKEVFVRIESINGKPVAFLVREEVSLSWIPPAIRRQAG